MFHESDLSNMTDSNLRHPYQIGPGNRSRRPLRWESTTIYSLPQIDFFSRPFFKGVQFSCQRQPIVRAIIVRTKKFYSLLLVSSLVFLGVIFHGSRSSLLVMATTAFRMRCINYIHHCPQAFIWFFLAAVWTTDLLTLGHVRYIYVCAPGYELIS
jgi:hypothetical protein